MRSPWESEMCNITSATSALSVSQNTKQRKQRSISQNDDLQFGSIKNNMNTSLGRASSRKGPKNRDRSGSCLGLTRTYTGKKI